MQLSGFCLCFFLVITLFITEKAGSGMEQAGTICAFPGSKNSFASISDLMGNTLQADHAIQERISHRLLEVISDGNY